VNRNFNRMSIEQKDVIDFVSIHPSGNAVLTISDHLPWDEENEHLILLQDKINAYLGAIEGGELYEAYPKAKGRKIVIRIVALDPPNRDGFLFLERAKEILTSAGYGFEFRQKPLSDTYDGL
jgi:hypothetical protein